MTSPTAQAPRSVRAPTRPATGLARPARPRRPLLVVVGVTLAALSAALVAALLNAATATTLVWATATDVARGHLVEPDDVVAVDVSSSAAQQLLPATVESREGLIGEVWAVDLPAGELLSPALVSQRLLVEDGQALVGLHLGPGEFPVVGLRPGEVVMVIDVGGQTGQQPRVLVDAATIESVAVLGDQDAAAARLVTVSVPESAAAAVTSAGSAGRASIAVVGQ